MSAPRFGEATLGDFDLGGLGVVDVVGTITPVIINIGLRSGHVTIGLRHATVTVGLRADSLSVGVEEALVLA